MEEPLKQQVGGNHYKSMGIQPVEYAEANKLGFLEGSIIKYVTRHGLKNGVEDLLKARHFIDMLLKLRYKVSPEGKPLNIDKDEEPEDGKVDYRDRGRETTASYRAMG